ncbi:monocarboxylate transporter 9 [Octopus bimaculoides]|uniref:Major facilitator superfamily (MFS) profile domain-containing protein n=1 Tax=Octopus bimaculoides TaxID=37653 RepID=A0A0L8G489_OCTBM|nr:monocarboxylate transporter 9 [Octopus bimaculoides]XP_014784378.1 monocarboxylate transporter 9 [Octopus bimaculoides]XP_014784379.1 monocarboxylate transporter 9 [Octopus bimaculoides]XP_014784380.1 monocarboxylate transporter 9 [Octopus bimaculoides]XP_052830959.1 monocarboxylate transporter 9 [Octopus bimaculoides]|eukprot:XP_014784377.1 PREDICTED: monocarboxylate transporter 9-like [Octopus bimaculoides]
MKSLSTSLRSIQSPMYIHSPDGGWGWVVCLSSFGINFILDGTLFCFGILYMDLLKYFDGSPAQIACVGSTLTGMHMMIGPVVSLLLMRFSHRYVAILGGFFAGLALAISTWVESVELLILIYGVCGGIGFGMVFITSNICLSLYFEKKRALATGLASSGAGLGTFCYPYLSEWLLSMYGWKGTVLILGGCALNCLVCGSVFRPLCWSSRSDLSSLRTEYTNGDDHNEDSDSVMSDAEEPTKNNLLDFKIKIVNLPVSNIKSSYTHSCHQLSHGISGWLTPNSLSVMDVNKSKIRSLHDINTSVELKHTGPRRRLSTTHFNPLIKQDIYYSGSVTTLRQDTLDHRRYSDLSEKSGNQKLQFNDAMSTFSEGSRCCQGNILRHVFNFALLKNKVFVALLTAFTLASMQSIAMMFLPNYGMHKGLSLTQSATLISVIGITNTIGRILIGLMTYSFDVPSIYSFTFSLLISGLISFAFIFCDTFASLIVCSGVFGLCMAVIVSLRTIVLADHLGIENLTHAFGVVALFQGIGFTVSPPLAGFLYEVYESYTILFCVVGTCYVTASVCSFALCLQVCCNRKKRSRRESLKIPSHDSDEESEVNAEIISVREIDDEEYVTKEVANYS